MSDYQSAVFELLAEDRQMISYRPSFARMIGSVTAALLLQQIVFRWKANGCKPFFKFKQACKQHKAYKEGDSWCEELAFGRSEFDGALSLIGTKMEKGLHPLFDWPNRKDFDTDESFQYAVTQAITHIVIYSTDADHKTWYSINVKLLVDAIGHHLNAKVENQLQYTNVENQLRILTENTREIASDSSLRSESSVSQPSNSTNADEAPSKQGEGLAEGQPSPVASSSGSLTKDKVQDGESSAAKLVETIFDAIPQELNVDISLETLRVKTNEPVANLTMALDVLLKLGRIRKTSDIPTFARATVARVAFCHHCNTDRSWTESMLKGVYGCDVCKSLVTEEILWPKVLAATNAKPIEPPEGFQLMSGTASDAPIHLRKAGQSLKAKPLCKAPLAYRLMPTPDMARSRKPCEECWKIATTPQQPKAKREKKPQPWDVLGEAIAKELFGAKDKAGVSAVFGRIAPVLHGDKRSGRCIGLIAYECEKQGKDKAELDYQALADMVPKFWKEYQRDNPGVTALKDCAKVLDAWQAWRGKKPKVRLEDLYEPVEPTESYIAPGPAR